MFHYIPHEKSLSKRSERLFIIARAKSSCFRSSFQAMSSLWQFSITSRKVVGNVLRSSQAWGQPEEMWTCWHKLWNFSYFYDDFSGDAGDRTCGYSTQECNEFLQKLIFTVFPKINFNFLVITVSIIRLTNFQFNSTSHYVPNPHFSSQLSLEGETFKSWETFLINHQCL